MRAAPAFLVFLSALPVLAQGAERHWYADIHWQPRSLSGNFQGNSDGNAFQVDLKNDLDLGRDGSQPGFGLEYQGPRFGLELTRDQQNYKGSSFLSRSISVDGTTYSANTAVNSTFKTTITTLNWTIRAFTQPSFWVGVDLGAQATQIEFDTTGFMPLFGVTGTANFKTTLPVPQLGPSAGFVALRGSLVGRGTLHFLAYKGATYTHPELDLRYFPISWLGLRAFYDAERFRVPRNSLKDNLDVTLDQGGVGFGIVARY